RSEEHTSELQSHLNLVCRLLLEKKKMAPKNRTSANISNLLNSTTQGNCSTPLCACLIALHARASILISSVSPSFFFFNDTATTEIYTLSLHDALPISVVKLSVGMMTSAEAPACTFCLIL